MNSSRVKHTRLVSVLVILSLLLLSCGQKEPTSSEDYTPINIEITYNLGRPHISWQTDKPTYGSVFYGKIPDDYDHFTYESSGLKESHSIKILDADSGFTYFFRIRVHAEDQVAAVSSEKTFIPQSASHEQVLEWTMLNISEGIAIGDCHFIETPNGYRAIIDSGSDDTVRRFYDFCTDRNLQQFNAAIATHLHWDHYGGFVRGILDRYSFDSLFIPHSHTPDYSWAYSEIRSEANSNGIGFGKIYPHTELDWDPLVNITVLHSGTIGDGDENNSSAVLKFSYGEIDFILTGDAESPAESVMLEHYSSALLDCEILKVGHHGRHDATSAEWLNAADPEAALISVDQKSSYDGNSLPSESVIRLLTEQGVDIYRSDKNYPNGEFYRYGHIQVITDGEIFEIIIN